jgi:hypothetical protein
MIRAGDLYGLYKLSSVARSCKCPYRSAAHIVYITYNDNDSLSVEAIDINNKCLS